MGRDQRRSVIAFTSVAAAFGFLALASVPTIDLPIAQWAAAHPRGGTFWDWGTQLLDLVALKKISNFLLGPILLLAGGALLLLRTTRRNGWMLLYVGAVQFTTTVVADLAKPLIGRLRPEEAIAGADKWLAAGNSFPSGHTAFYAGLFFPLMLIAPRWTFLWAIPPLFIAAARVLEHDHYLSDVSASLALAALVAGGLAFILRRADDY
ncbi:MAG TPA: phosphatase PAP2 family protein [Allosphingosinicella sp.]